MRVIQVLKVLSVALLSLPLIAVSAGAIYLEGQAPPDDGQMHILAAESGLATDGAVPLDSAPAGDGDIIPISAMAPSAYTVSPAISSAMFSDVPTKLIVPSALIKNCPGTSADLVVGPTGPVMMPKFWDSINTDSLKVNIPIINF